jgi:hypothetical protein
MPNDAVNLLIVMNGKTGKGMTGSLFLQFLCTNGAKIKCNIVGWLVVIQQNCKDFVCL